MLTDFFNYITPTGTDAGYYACSVTGTNAVLTPATLTKAAAQVLTVTLVPGTGIATTITVTCTNSKTVSDKAHTGAITVL